MINPRVNQNPIQIIRKANASINVFTIPVSVHTKCFRTAATPALRRAASPFFSKSFNRFSIGGHNCLLGVAICLCLTLKVLQLKTSLHGGLCQEDHLKSAAKQCPQITGTTPTAMLCSRLPLEKQLLPSPWGITWKRDRLRSLFSLSNHALLGFCRFARFVPSLPHTLHAPRPSQIKRRSIVKGKTLPMWGLDPAYIANTSRSSSP